MECEIEDALDRRLKYVNDWLQFAEKKNSTLLVLNAGAVWGVSRLLTHPENYELLTNSLLWLGLVAVGISGILCMTSLLPNLKLKVLNTTAEISETDNSFFFGDIAKYDVAKFLELIVSSYELENKRFLKSHKDYAQQLIANSRIAYQKYKIFRISSHLTVYGFISLFIFCTSLVVEGKL